MLSKPKLLGFAVACVVSLLPAHAIAEPLRFTRGAQCTTDGGTQLRLDPGYYLPSLMWDNVDAEMRRLQEAETRLQAENASLRAKPEVMSWGMVVVAATTLIGGIAIGALR